MSQFSTNCLFAHVSNEKFSQFYLIIQAEKLVIFFSKKCKRIELIKPMFFFLVKRVIKIAVKEKSVDTRNGDKTTQAKAKANIIPIKKSISMNVNK